MKKLALTACTSPFLLILGIASMLLSSSLSAAEKINLAQQQIMQTAEKYVLQHMVNIDTGNIEVKASSIDPRIDIPPCPSGLDAQASEEALKQANVTVKVSCTSTNWYLYLTVKTIQIQPVVVLASSLSPGTILSAQHLQVVQMDKKLLRSTTFADIEEVVGARIKRRSRPGTPLVPQQLCFVCKGDRITISAKSAGLEIKTTGIAQQEGNLGETIRVTNQSSNKTVHARVISAKRVQVQI